MKTYLIFYSEYIACDYDPADGVFAYINENVYRYYTEDYQPNVTLFASNDDGMATNISLECVLSQKGTFDTFHETITYSHVEAYTSFDVGFKMVGMTSLFSYEFGAISGIQVTCNKLNASANIPDPIPNTPAPTILPIQNPANNSACSSNANQTTCNTADSCSWDSQCG